MLISRAKNALAQSKIETATLGWCAGIAKVEALQGSCGGSAGQSSSSVYPSKAASIRPQSWNHSFCAFLFFA